MKTKAAGKARIIVQLSRPLQVWTRTKTELVFSQPKFADMRAIFRGRNTAELNMTGDTVFVLLSRCSGLPRRVLEGLGHQGLSQML